MYASENERDRERETSVNYSEKSARLSSAQIFSVDYHFFVPNYAASK